MASSKGIGIPIKLMHESEGHVLTVSSVSYILPCALVSPCAATVPALSRRISTDLLSKALLCFDIDTCWVIHGGLSPPLSTPFAVSEDMRYCSSAQVELKSGQTYRGELFEAEDNWNCQLKNVTATERVRRLNRSVLDCHALPFVFL